jgi:hypothetical protein
VKAVKRKEVRRRERDLNRGRGSLESEEAG